MSNTCTFLVQVDTDTGYVHIGDMEGEHGRFQLTPAQARRIAERMLEAAAEAEIYQAALSSDLS